MHPLTERHSATPYRDFAIKAGLDAGYVDRVIGLLPLMTTGYEAIRNDLASALAVLHPPGPGMAGTDELLDRLGWTAAEREELAAGLARLLSDPRTPEEWVAHDTVAAAQRLSDVRWITPMGIHTEGKLEPLAEPPEPRTAERGAVLSELADRILADAPDHPIRVGLDGGTCAGKSMLGEELADEFRQRGIWAVRSCADFFKLPLDRRPGGSFRTVYDRPSLRRELLEPLGPGGDRLIRTASWDGWTQRSLLDRPRLAVPDDGVAVVDGSMMLTAPELEGLLDFRIWVHASLEARRERMITRDVLWTEDPSPEAMRKKFDSRYVPDEEAYRFESGVESIVDAVVDNENPARPRLSLR